MKILAIDTATVSATAAIYTEEGLLSEYTLNKQLTHSEVMLPMIDSILKASGVSPKEIDLYAASVGPGSFTGIRIGVATVKAMAMAAGKPVVGVNTLEALAYNLQYQDGVTVPIIDARREQVYNAVYRFDSRRAVELEATSADDINSLLNRLSAIDEKICFVGDAVMLYKDRIIESLGSKAVIAPYNNMICRASSVAAAAMFKEQLTPEMLLPYYLKKSQAEREADEREKGGNN